MENSIRLKFDNRTGEMKCQSKYDLDKAYEKIDQLRAKY